MSHLVLTIGPAHTLRQAARMMSARRIGAAVVIDPEHAGIGILTERDLLDSIAKGEDPDAELVAQHRTESLVYASPDWTLEEAAAAMIRGGFRHLVVIEELRRGRAAVHARHRPLLDLGRRAGPARDHLGLKGHAPLSGSRVPRCPVPVCVLFRGRVR